DSDWELLLAGTVEVLGEGISAKVDFEVKDGQLIFRDFGFAARGLNPGIPVFSTGAYLTDLGGEIANLGQGKFKIDAVIGGTSGSGVPIGATGAARATLIAEGSFTTAPFTADVKGTLQLVGGLLGEVLAELKVDHPLTVVDLDGRFLYEIFEGHARLVVV